MAVQRRQLDPSVARAQSLSPPAGHGDLFEGFSEQNLREALNDQTRALARLVLHAERRGDTFWRDELQILADLTLAEAKELAA